MTVWVELDDDLVKTLQQFRSGGHPSAADFSGLADRLLGVVYHAIDDVAERPLTSPHSGGGTLTMPGGVVFDAPKEGESYEHWIRRL